MFGQGLIKGLQITWGRMFDKKQTVKYPFEKIEMFPRYHGRFELDVDKCIACGLCANACPNKVIQLEKEKVDKKQFLTKYIMRIEYCLFCGLCVEACNKDALKFSNIIDMNQYRRSWVRLTLVDRPAPEPTETPEEETPAKEAKSEAAAGQAPGKEG
ncbi:MAG: NADH-quinone oxidoreductase [Peptococcaceae bacterium BICA1-7]|nr:MAG: NADH-quinone oxidoreductase [Peptococcaceae bacterium BICA1-7]HBV98914.1 4Fe-4S dicluster domain-containing protein [Desulfotomaculum sp.]